MTTTLAPRKLATAQLQEKSEELKAEHPGLVLHLFRRAPREVVLELISVPAGARRRRIGTTVMSALCAEADHLGLSITLHVSDGFGTSRSVLADFYGAHGYHRVCPRSAAMRRDPVAA